ncbi:hypothetical protein [Pectinatus frisingensis]|uniref:hypothetical protein n=1 Tax=Pectinatus frisingensis TaxID=865 RepID=UPI0018C85301|nr:hypothetical protein [Pectinatus frisingensis]
MYDIGQIMQLLNGAFSNMIVQNFLINLGSSAVWDGLKKIAKGHHCDPNLGSQTWDVLRNTMQQFYEYKEYEYDEEIVMRNFCGQYNIHDGISTETNFRAILEKTICITLTDEDYRKWLNFFCENCFNNQLLFNKIQLNEGFKNKTFSDRDLVFQRLEAKLLRYADSKECETEYCLRLDSVFEQLDLLFNNSWKEEVLHLITRLPHEQYNQDEINKKLSFIHSNEDCDDVLVQIKELLDLYDFEKAKSENKSEIRELLKYPHYYKVLVVTGTTGSGKTFFVNRYIKYCLEKLKTRAISIIPYVVDISKVVSISNLEQLLLAEMEDLFGKSVQSLEDASKLLSHLPIKICFVIENIHLIIDEKSKWCSLVSSINRFSRYESFKWLLTINGYEYYALEDTPKFLQRYCIEKNFLLMISKKSPAIFQHAINMDELNKEWHVVETILQKTLSGHINNTYVDVNKGITTPLEALYFGECIIGEELVSFPSTYYEFIKKIVGWKARELADCSSTDVQSTVLAIADCIMEKLNCVIKDSELNKSDLRCLRSVQLLSSTITICRDIFSVSQAFQQISYRIRVLPYWAAIMVGNCFCSKEFKVKSITGYPSELKEWLIPCYIFYNAQNENELLNLFPVLKESSLLEYALFCSQRDSSVFSRALYNFIINNIDYITNSKRCYSVFYFVFYCPLKISQKFKLLISIAEKVKEFNLLYLYSRVFESIVHTSGKLKQLKKNMLELAPCDVSDINFINGYEAGKVFMHLSKKEVKSFDIVIKDIIAYIYEHESILEIIKNGNNNSYFDFFIRKCMEIYLYSTIKDLRTVYCDFEEYFKNKQPVGAYIKRNLTCAAGNLFSSHGKHPSGFDEEYIGLVAYFAGKKEYYEKATAWFLIKNSISEKEDKLDKRLYNILSELVSDEKILALYEKEGSTFLSEKLEPMKKSL